MANNLNTDERKWVLKEYWKSQNAETVRTKNGLKHLVLNPQGEKLFTALVTNLMPLAQFLMHQKLVDPKQFAQRTISKLLPKHLCTVLKSPPEEPLQNWRFHKLLLEEF